MTPGSARALSLSSVIAACFDWFAAAAGHATGCILSGHVRWYHGNWKNYWSRSRARAKVLQNLTVGGAIHGFS